MHSYCYDIHSLFINVICQILVKIALYRYWLQKTTVDEGKPRFTVTVVFEGWQFPMLTSCAGNIYHIILNATENIPYTLRRVSKQSRSSVEYLRLFLYSVYSNAQIRPGKIYMYGKLFVQEFCPVYIFLEYQPSSSNNTRCQVPSCVRAWFHDSAGDIDFYQKFLRQSELSSLHFTWKYNYCVVV